MENVTIYLDFDDVLTYQIFHNRYLATSSIMGIGCNIHAVPFGESPKVHARMTLNGSPEDISRFLEFVEETIGLLENEEGK